MKKIIFESIRISFNKTWIYKFEYLMILIHIIFNLLFVVVFWSSLTNTFILPIMYQQKDVYLFSGLIMISNTLGELFFGINYLPYEINNGDFDLYLIRPKNLFVHYFLDHINIFAIVEGLIVSSIYFWTIYLNNYSFDLLRCLYCFILLGLGTLIMQIFNCIVSMSSFWLGLIDNFRILISTFSEIKNYPMGLFPTSIRFVFTTLVPISFISFYPLEILIGNIDMSMEIVIVYLLSIIIIYLLFSVIKRKGLNHYESNN